ncbi:GNAT family N-acetyltransferase [Cytobacillus purgationiresistens]|uniref:RimJ/RimL family protein N-acetyltransferase n=1 Tax=Cytobacillus purgationiresistens TaxID=863449 RepID=A0ABU0AT02_9BACI|nr:GNAT family N-acetyltransferase [Cytobacillus purgationiresistens]MDQ0273170.1 RimJ/RimL family protein N-acetyltransferase [Cytobacillus purgationiresistens]
MLTNTIVRTMKIEDIPQIQKVAKESWNATYEGIIPKQAQESFLQSAYSDKMLVRRLEQSVFFVAEWDDRIIGFANYSQMRKDGEVELGAIYLSPGVQGKGLGTVLLQAGIDHFDDVKTIMINVAKDNRIGRNFYDAKGFQQIAEFDDLFKGQLIETITMVLKIDKK